MQTGTKSLQLPPAATFSLNKTATFKPAHLHLEAFIPEQDCSKTDLSLFAKNLPVTRLRRFPITYMTIKKEKEKVLHHLLCDRRGTNLMALLLTQTNSL